MCSNRHGCQRITLKPQIAFLFAGVIFWQWGFAPYVSEEFLEGCIHCQAIQVSSSDGVFKNIIAPAADYAHKVALTRSPVAGCKAGMLPLHCHSFIMSLYFYYICYIEVFPIRCKSIVAGRATTLLRYSHAASSQLPSCCAGLLHCKLLRLCWSPCMAVESRVKVCFVCMCMHGIFASVTPFHGPYIAD